MKAEIITSGTELLLGEITDSNTPYIARQLASLGIDLYYTSTVGDNFERYTGVLKQAWDRSDLIIITGGLGPTQGDITREVIAGIVAEEMAVDSTLKDEVTAFFNKRNLEMPENNLKQATLIPSAVPLHNNAGTAPGWWVEKEGRIIVALPGPPSEMQAMWHNEVVPRLSNKGGAVIISRTLKTWGFSEGKVDQIVSPFLSTPNPTLALYAKPDGIHLRITAKAMTDADAQDLISTREREIRESLGEHIWGVDDETIAGVVGRLLDSRKITLSIAESFTGGLLAYTLSSIHGGSKYYKGGIVLSEDAKADLDLKSETAPVKTGKDAVANMASQVRVQFNSEIGLAIDGYCDAAANTQMGRIFVAIESDVKSEVTEQSLPGRPEQVVHRAINHALFCLKRFIELP